MHEQRLGSRYLLLDRLGGGGMGEVFLARTSRDAEVRLAVKLLRPEFAEDLDLVSRFLQESRLLRGVRHPNVVRVLDLVAEGDRLGIVMEYVPDGDLRRAVPLPCPTGAALELLAQVADGLAAIHAAGITHRDLKPENVLVQLMPAGTLRARVTDFGVSHRSDSVSTRHNGIVGTVGYLSPESANGLRAGPAGDVYALGIMLFEMCTGSRPFVAENPLAVIRAHAESPVPRPPAMAEPIWELLSDLLAKDPAQRPTSAEVGYRLRSLAGPQSDVTTSDVTKSDVTTSDVTSSDVTSSDVTNGSDEVTIHTVGQGRRRVAAGRALGELRPSGPSVAPWRDRREAMSVILGVVLVLVLVIGLVVMLGGGDGSGTATAAATPTLTASATTSTPAVPAIPTLELYQPTQSSVQESDRRAPLSIGSVDPGAGTLSSIMVLYDGGTQSVAPRSGFKGPYRTTITGLQNGRAYTFTVRVCNSFGECSSSRRLTFTPYTIPTLGALSAVASQTSATVTWPALNLDGDPRPWTCRLSANTFPDDLRAPHQLPVSLEGGSITWRPDDHENYTALETCTDGSRTVISPLLTFRTD